MSVRLENIGKAYGEHVIFDGLNLEVADGEFLGIRGESGKGKSTLLNIIGGLEPHTGKVYVDDEWIPFGNRKKQRELLKGTVGYLFQNFALVEEKSIYYNLKIVLPKMKKAKALECIREALLKVGLDKDPKEKICRLSGGEQQRVALARIILHKSKIILADEPTGSLDEKNAKQVMELLKRMNEEGRTIIMVSHNQESLDYCSRLIDL